MNSEILKNHIVSLYQNLFFEPKRGDIHEAQYINPKCYIDSKFNVYFSIDRVDSLGKCTYNFEANILEDPIDFDINYDIGENVYLYISLHPDYISAVKIKDMLIQLKMLLTQSP